MQLSQAVMKLTEDVVRFSTELHKIPELGLGRIQNEGIFAKQLQSFRDQRNLSGSGYRIDRCFSQ